MERLLLPFFARTRGSRARGAALCALALPVLACQEPPSGDGGDTGAVGAELLRSAEDDTTGSGQGRMSRTQAPPPSLAAPRTEIPMAELGHLMGDSTAPVRIVEFSDFGCGYCRQFHMDVFPALEEEYIATGKVQWRYIPMLLGAFGPSAEVAARAGECALAQDRFPAMRDRLFENQPEWKGSGDVTAILEGYAADLGLDVAEWRQCVEEDEPGDRIRSGTAAAFEAGVRGTPTFFVLGYAPIPGALPVDLFRTVLDTVYADATSR